MKFFLDTANIEEIEELIPTGFVDGVTTNPSLIAKNGDDMAKTIKSICSIVSGPVSAEVTATDYETMLKEGEYLASFAKNVAVKVPLTFNGLKACKALRDKNIMVKGDKGKLRRIFLNIISNAIKFTTEGHITIICKKTEHDVKISITDTGIGIRDSEKEIIFEKFRQIDYSSRREYDGIGLGLSIVKELVEIHNGHIEIDSSYGKGSTFTVCLPTIKEQLTLI